MAYSASASIIVTSIGLVVAPISVGLRLYVRRILLHALQWDDLFAVLAFIAYIAQSGTYLDALINHGLGQRTNASTTAASSAKALKDFFISELLFLLGSCLVKISFALTLLRIVRSRYHTWTIYLALSLAASIGIITFFLVLFTCRPISAFWNSGSGTCRNLSVQVAASYAHGAVNLFVDVLLGIVLPANLLYKLQMQSRVKILAGFLLSLGSIASIATIMRIYYTSQYDIADFLFAVNIPFLWAGIELATSIVCTSGATLKPLLVKLRVVSSSSARDTSNHELESGKDLRRHITTAGPLGSRRLSISGSSAEEITWVGKEETRRGITRTMEYSVSAPDTR